MKQSLIPMNRGSAFLAAISTGTLVWVLTSAYDISHTPLMRSPTGSQQPQHPQVPFANAVTQPSEAEAYSSHLPHSLSEITRLDPRGSSAEDRAVVWQFLRQIQPSSPELEWLIGADEALSWLRGASHAGEEIERELALLIADRNTPVALREYAAEHLGLWADEHPEATIAPGALEQAAAEAPPSRLSGIALAALARWPSLNKNKNGMIASALAIASNAEADPFAQTVALEIIGGSNHPETERLARVFIEENSTFAKKQCALEILGRIGTPATLAWLIALPEPRDTLTADALRKALRTLRERQATSSK